MPEILWILYSLSTHEFYKRNYLSYLEQFSPWVCNCSCRSCAYTLPSDKFWIKKKNLQLARLTNIISLLSVFFLFSHCFFYELQQRMLKAPRRKPGRISSYQIEASFIVEFFLIGKPCNFQQIYVRSPLLQNYNRVIVVLLLPLPWYSDYLI